MCVRNNSLFTLVTYLYGQRGNPSAEICGRVFPFKCCSACRLTNSVLAIVITYPLNPNGRCKVAYCHKANGVCTLPITRRPLYHFTFCPELPGLGPGHTQGSYPGLF